MRYSKNRLPPEVPARIEIGVVYRIGGNLRIAIPGGRFFSIQRGVVRVETPRSRTKIEVVRRAAFDDLCEAWNTTAERIDAELGKLMAPVTPAHASPRGRHP